MRASGAVQNMRLPTLWALGVITASLCAVWVFSPASLLAHGLFSKPLSNKKVNRATRGLAKGGATTLAMMKPQLHSYGRFQTIGWDCRMQDEEAATQELVRFRVVRFAKDGVSPDLSAAGTVLSLKVKLFGLGMKGVTARDFRITIGFPTQVPDACGFAVDLPANSNWPKDGATLHGQLNLPNDSLRPRVPAPFANQVWAFEKAANAVSPKALGGRTLDSLELSPLYVEPVLARFLSSTAYGLGREELRGPESMHPDAARGDAFGFEIGAGIVGANGYCVILLGTQLRPKPLRLPFFGWWHLVDRAPFPFPLHVHALDALGNGKTGTWAAKLLPKSFRKFFAQGLILNPSTLEYEATDVVGFDGV